MNLVNQLQVSAESDDVLTVLRKAKRLASKLGVTDIDHWLQCEQEGYGEGDAIPKYRTVKGHLVYNTNGPIPAGLGMVVRGIIDFPGAITRDEPLGESMGEIVSMVAAATERNHGLYLTIDAASARELCRLLHPMIANQVTFLLQINAGQVRAIPEAVKDRVLDWACELERRGVLGEDMAFNDYEKEQAHGMRLDFRDCTIQQLGAINNKEPVKMSDNRNSISTGGGSISVGRDLVQARDITCSFNALADKADKPEVAALLKKLAESLNEVLANLPPDHAEQVAADAEAFAKEAASRSPRSAILTALKDGLLATIKMGYTAALPVVTPLLTAVMKAAVA